MAQKRFTTYKAAVESFPLGEQHVGIFKPGRYNGYDSMTTSDNITLTIAHTGIIKKTDPLGNQVGLYGVAIMPTGVIIHEEGPLTINLPSVSDPLIEEPQTRKFALVIEHNYQQVKGGVKANYLIIAGEPGTTVPALTNPKSQILLGVITKDYTNNTLTYKKQVNHILGDMSNLELFRLIEPYIPNPELPDIEQTILTLIKANKPRLIITPEFDIAESTSLSNWTTIPYTENPNQQPGHNLPNHTVEVRQVRVSTGNSYLDISIANSGNNVSWEWGTSQMIGFNTINTQDQGAHVLEPLEIKETNVTGPGKVRRWQMRETASSVQKVSLRVTLQHTSMLTGVGSGGTETTQEFISSSKTLVGISPVYDYGEVITISSSGDWTVTSDNPAVTAMPTNGKAGDTSVTVNVEGTTGYIEGTLTFTLTGTTKSVQVTVYKDNNYL